MIVVRVIVIIVLRLRFSILSVLIVLVLCVVYSNNWWRYQLSAGFGHEGSEYQSCNED